MTSVSPESPTPWAPQSVAPRGQVLGWFALVAAFLAASAVLVLILPGDPYIKLVLLVVDFAVVPVLSLVAIILGILAIRSRVQPNRTLGIVAVAIVALIVLTVVGEILYASALHRSVF